MAWIHIETHEGQIGDAKAIFQAIGFGVDEASVIAHRLLNSTRCLIHTNSLAGKNIDLNRLLLSFRQAGFGVVYTGVEPETKSC